jgi:hypothetical protein
MTDKGRHYFDTLKEELRGDPPKDPELRQAYKDGYNAGLEAAVQVLDRVQQANTRSDQSGQAAREIYQGSEIMRLIGAQDVGEIIATQIDGRSEAVRAIDEIVQANADSEIEWVCMDALTYGYIMGKRAERRKHSKDNR